MPLINLIQEQRLTHKANERKARLFLFGLAGSVGLSMTGFGFLMFQGDQLSSEESRLKAKAQKVAPLANEIDTLKAQISDIGPKLTTLTNAQETTGKWTRILGHLTQHTPPQTWLTGMRCTATDPTKPIQLIFAGMSSRQELVGEFILRLQGCDDLDKVELKFTQEKIVSNARNIEFELSTDIKGTAEEKPVKEEEEKS